MFVLCGNYRTEKDQNMKSFAFPIDSLPICPTTAAEYVVEKLFGWNYKTLRRDRYVACGKSGFTTVHIAATRRDSAVGIVFELKRG